MYPIDANPMLIKFGIHEFQPRMDRITSVPDLLNRKIDEIMRVKAKVEAQFDEFMRILEDRKISKLQQIEEFKKTVEDEKEKYQQHIMYLQYNTDYQPANSLEKIVYDNGSLDSLDLIEFNYSNSKDDPNVLIFKTKVTYNRSLFALAEGRSFLPILKGNSLFKLDLEGRTAASKIDLKNCSTDFENCQTCFLGEEGHLFVCGGLNTNIDAFDITLATGNVRKLPKMYGRREGGHGVIYVSPFVYVFGGRHRVRDLDSAERFDVEHSAWEELNPMKACRSQFTPCSYQEAIYLIGGNNRTIEKFTIVSNSYLEIYGTTVESRGQCLSFLIGNSFIIFSGTKLFKADAQKMKTIELEDRDQSAPTSVIAPFFRGNAWYFTNIDQNDCITIGKYDISTSSIEFTISTDLADLR